MALDKTCWAVSNVVFDIVVVVVVVVFIVVVFRCFFYNALDL